jgi:hypothetical protein
MTSAGGAAPVFFSLRQIFALRLLRSDSNDISQLRQCDAPLALELLTNFPALTRWANFWSRL